MKFKIFFLLILCVGVSKAYTQSEYIFENAITKNGHIVFANIISGDPAQT